MRAQLRGAWCARTPTACQEAARADALPNSLQLNREAHRARGEMINEQARRPRVNVLLSAANMRLSSDSRRRTLA